jgi:uncharacterized integral membrane protein
MEKAEEYTGYSLEAQIATAGIHYPRSYDIAYRIGYIVQLSGILIFTISFLLELPSYIIGIILFEIGVTLSAIFLLVWKREIKRFILFSIAIGILLQAMGYIFFPSYLKEIFIVGLGFICIGGAGLVGKEAYCFNFFEGWLILLLYPIIIFSSLLGAESRIFFAILYLSLLLLHASFLRKKLGQPLLHGCDTGVCGLPVDDS